MENEKKNDIPLPFTLYRTKELLTVRKTSILAFCKKYDLPYNTFDTAKRRNTELKIEFIFIICGKLEISMSEFFKGMEDYAA